MADINWGILQPAQGAGIQNSMGSAPGSPAPQANPGQATMNNILGNAAEMQRARLLQKEGARAEAMQPGLLQEQALRNKALGLGVQEAQAKMAANDYAVKVRQATSQAFMEGSAKGGTNGGLEAAQRKMMEMGDIEGAILQAKTSEELNKLKADNNTTGIAALGNAVAGIVSGAKPDQVDPKTGQKVPGVTSLQLYAQQYPTLKKMYPNAPAPNEFKDDGQFHDAFTVPVLATAGPIAKQKQLDMEALKDDALHKAQVQVGSNVEALQRAIRDYGPTSKEAADAAGSLSEAQGAARRAAVGGGLGAGIAAKLPASLGGLENPEDLIKQNAPGYKAPKDTLFLQGGNEQAPAFSASEIQAELARRSGQK